MTDLASLFVYEPDTGRLLWRTSSPKRVVGREAGSVRGDRKYRTVHFNGHRRLVHRIAWEIVNGPLPTGRCIDHLDGNGLNNRLVNLRIATLSENQKNRRLSRNNKTGISGVSAKAVRGRFRYEARIGALVLLNTADFFEACCARKSAELRHGFTERGRRGIT